MIIKCKMCGGDLVIQDASPVCVCEFCGTSQTVPAADNEKKVNLFNRANRLRMNAEFDKAAVVYESIASEFPEEAETYWGLCLCAYGIEYVDDPATGEKKPTCHRTLPVSIMEDSNFEQACDNADAVARRAYREEAKAIDRIQKDILAIVSSEDPYDVFICYKETAEEGGRTEDSVLAQEIYDALTGKGLKVFFSRITLEDKLGQQYEPYIYAALSSAKVMLAVGTKFEYYDAVWVKNEWARFLSMMKTDKDKTLIPCFKDLDAYDMPKEFRNLQAQDMGKLGWLQDLSRGVMKLCGKGSEVSGTAVLQSASGGSPTTDNLLRRAFVFLEDADWESADEYADKVLDLDVGSGEAYLVKLMAEKKVGTREKLADLDEPFEDNGYYQKIVRFGSEKLKTDMVHMLQTIHDRNEQLKIVKLYNQAKTAMVQAKTIEVLQEARRRFLGCGDYLDAGEMAEKCEQLCKQILYNQVKDDLARAETVEALKAAREKLRSYGDYPDAVQMAEVYDRYIEAEETVSALKKEYNQAVSAYQTAEKPLLSYKAEQDRMDSLISDITKKILKCRNELNNLHGLFAGKRQKELEQTIGTYESQQDETLNRINAIRQKIAETEQGMPKKPDDNEMAYRIALIYRNAGNDEKAYTYYRSIRGYRDVDSLLAEMLAENPKLKYMVSNYVTFGTYPQTAGGNDNTPIEWLVLARDGQKALLISRYGLEAKPYNTENTGITWEACTLRQWLNDEFLNKAFTAGEQKAILMKEVDNSPAQGYSGWGTTGGNNTQDRIFLLSYAEAKRYFDVTYENSNNKKSRVALTAHAIQTGAHTSSSNKTANGAPAGWWWLRSPGYHQNIAASVFTDGSLYYYSVNYDNAVVRPAFWLNLDSDII